MSADAMRARSAVEAVDLAWPSLSALLDERARDEATALTWADRTRQTWSGADLVRGMRAVAYRLLQHEVREGDVVAVVAENHPRTLLLCAAAWQLGATFMPIDPHESRDRRGEMLATCTRPLLVCEADDALPGARHVTFDDVTDTGRAHEPLPDPALGLDAVALRMHTSGTSGTPKPILTTMRSLLLDCMAMRDRFGWGRHTKTLTVLPISHTNGLVISSILPWVVGGSSVLVDRFSASTFWPLVKDESISACSLVPTMLEYLNANAAVDTDTGSLQHVLSGSGPMRPDTADEFERHFAVPVRQLYGLSETAAVVTATPPMSLGSLEGRWRASIGPALQHADVAVHAPSGKPCDAGEAGELVVRGAVLMLGYADQPEATDEAFSDGWFHTGDRGAWLPGPDGRPWYFVDGRLADVVRRAGSSVQLDAVDAVVAMHPDVHQAASFGFPHRWYGEEVAVAIVTERQLDHEQVLDWCEQQLGHEDSPKVVFTVGSLPTTALGKIRRGVLAQQLRPSLAAQWDTRFRSRATTNRDVRRAKPEERNR